MGSADGARDVSAALIAGAILLAALIIADKLEQIASRHRRK